MQYQPTYPDFVSQRDNMLETPVQRSICGVASLAMCLQIAGYPKVTITALLSQLIELSNASLPTVFWETNGLTIPINYDHTNSIPPQTLLAEATEVLRNLGGHTHSNNLYVDTKPTTNEGSFNLLNGLDYRLVPALLATYYPNATCLLSLSNTDVNLGCLLEQLNMPGTSAILSVNHPGFGDSWKKEQEQSRHVIHVSHVLCAPDGAVYYSDPSRFAAEEGQAVCSLDYLTKHFAGNIALIQIKQNNES